MPLVYDGTNYVWQSNSQPFSTPDPYGPQNIQAPAPGMGWSGNLDTWVNGQGVQHGTGNIYIGGLRTDATRDEALAYLRDNPDMQDSINRGMASPDLYNSLYGGQGLPGYMDRYNQTQGAINKSVGHGPFEGRAWDAFLLSSAALIAGGAIGGAFAGAGAGAGSGGGAAGGAAGGAGVGAGAGAAGAGGLEGITVTGSALGGGAAGIGAGAGAAAGGAAAGTNTGGSNGSSTPSNSHWWDNIPTSSGNSNNNSSSNGSSSNGGNMDWLGAAVNLGGAYLSNRSSNSAANGSRYQPMNVFGPDGSVNINRGSMTMQGNPQFNGLNDSLTGLYGGQLAGFANQQQNALGMNYLNQANNQANGSQDQLLQGLYGASGQPGAFFNPNGQNQFQQQAQMSGRLGNQALTSAYGGYGGQNYMQAGQNMLGGYQNQNFNNLSGNLLTNFDPNQASQQYTDLLRQQAQPQEQQAVQSQMDSLFGNGRLGTTGGANVLGQLSLAQQQADVSRQVAGQQFGLQQQLQAQQGRDSALTAEQNRQLGGFGANQQGMMNQFGLAQQLGQTGAGLMGSAYTNAGLGMGLSQMGDQYGYNRLQQQNQTNWDRSNTMYNNANTATTDRFNRSMQMFGADNAIGQQYLGNFQGLLGSQQSQNQQLMDQARIGASVGQAQTSSNANASQLRNNSNQDMIAGFLAAYNNQNKGN